VVDVVVDRDMSCPFFVRKVSRPERGSVRRSSDMQSMRLGFVRVRMRGYEELIGPGR